MNTNNPLNLPSQLPIARYRFSIALNKDLHLPAQAGSTLRGVFGHALIAKGLDKLIFHAPPNPNLNRSQQQNPPQAYIIEAPHDGITHYPANSQYHFNLVLIGHLRHHLPHIASAFHEAFNKGVGANKATGNLCRIAVEQTTANTAAANHWQSIWNGGSIAEHHNHISLSPQQPPHLELQLLTPLRLQSQGKILNTDNISAAYLLRQLMRRCATIAQTYFATPIHTDYSALSASAEQVQEKRQLHWQDYPRYSNRQQQEMNLGGLIGTWQLYQLPPAYSQLLQLGQWLHIGKETTFGHGHYRLNTISAEL